MVNVMDDLRHDLRPGIVCQVSIIREGLLLRDGNTGMPAVEDANEEKDARDKDKDKERADEEETRDRSEEIDMSGEQRMRKQPHGRHRMKE